MIKFDSIWCHRRLKTDALINRSAARTWLSAYGGHYVYILALECGEPFYVGKGYGMRALQHESDARSTTIRSHKLNLIRKAQAGAGVYYVLLEACEHAEALTLEVELIERIGRADKKKGPLTNQTAGGEGTLDPSPESLARRRDTLAGESDDETRNLVNRWFAELSRVGSVPIKPVDSRYRINGLWKNRETFAVSERQAAALAGALIATNNLLESGVVVPRRFKVSGKEVIIENGVGRDLLSSGMAELVTDETGFETLRVTDTGVSAIKRLIDDQLLVSAGVLTP